MNDEADNPLKYFIGEPDKAIVKSTHPWDRWPNETAKAYHAFCLYRDSGHDRTIVAIAQELGMTYRDGADGRIKSNSVVNGWVSQFRWKHRVRQYDEWSEKRQRAIVERKRKEMMERQATVGEAMTAKAQAALEANIIQPESVRDIVMLAETGTRIERLARGESTENVAHGVKFVISHPLPPWVPQQVQQLAEYIEEEDSSHDGPNNSGSDDVA